MSAPLVVCMFDNERVRGGAEEHMLCLLKGLDRARFRPLLVCPPELLAQLVPELPKDVTPESHILCIQADVTSSEDVQKYVHTTVKAWGRLDTAFLCAGFSYNSTSIFDTTEETWDKVMNINTRSGTILYLR